MIPKISAIHPRAVIFHAEIEPVGLGDALTQIAEIRLIDLGVCREDDDLMAGERKIVLRQKPSMVRVQSTQGRINDDREWAPRGFR